MSHCQFLNYLFNRWNYDFYNMTTERMGGFFFIKYQIYNDCQFGLVIINIYRILICWHIIKQKDHNLRKEKGVNK